jgi:beta-glucanase (GH16 family)
MKYFLFALLSTNCLKSQYLWQVTSDTIIKWYYHDGDEFNGNTVDLDKWLPTYSWTEVNYSFDYLMTPKRLEFENGICKFTCYRDTGLYQVPEWQLDSAFRVKYKSSLVDGNKFRYYYSAGNVRSKQSYRKGYFEIRFKTTDSYGMWPAFWLYGKDKDEIDFFELKGERSKDIHVDVHCLKGCDNGYRGGGFFPRTFGGWIKTTANLNEDYNIVAGEWQDDYVKWYLNGEGIAYYKGEFATPKMHLLIGTGPAKDGLGFEPGINSTSYFPNSLDVDYVRIWYKDEKDAEEILGKKQKLFDYYKTEKSGDAKLKKKIRFMYNKKAFRNDALTISVLPASNKKLIISSTGKNIDFNLSIFEPSGKEILSRNITSAFEELDLSTLTKEKNIKIKLLARGKVIEQELSSN